MKYNLSILLFFICALSYGQGIDFYGGSWEETLAKAKEENKLIFVDAYTSWCGPCKKMAKLTFTDDKVGKVFNEKYVNQKMDMESVDNTSFINKYPVRAYPTLFFINGDGEVVHTAVGFQDVNGLLSFSAAAEKKDDQSVNFVEAYEAGNRDYKFVLDYISALNKVGKPSLKISNDYLKSNPKITQKEKAAFLLEATVESDSKIYDQLIENKKTVIELVGQDVFKLKVKSACSKTVNKAVEFEVLDLVEEAIEKYGKEHSKNDKKEFAYQARMEYYRASGLTEDYVSQAHEYYKKVAKKDNEKLDKLIEEIHKVKDNNKAKKLMRDAGKQLVKNEDTWKNRVTYSQTLMINEEMTAAMEQANKALEKVGDDPRDKQQVDGLIRLIKARLRS